MIIVRYFLFSKLFKNSMIKQISQKIIANITKNISQYSNNNLIYVCGPMGSGKTTYIKKTILKKYPTYFPCFTDEYIPYFADNETDPRKLFKLCREVGIIVSDFLLENNISMIIEGTGIHMDTIEYFKNLKQKGYNITTYFIRTDLEICRTRVENRNKIKDNLHKVLDEDVINYYNTLWIGSKDKFKMEELIQNISDEIINIENYSIS